MKLEYVRTDKNGTKIYNDYTCPRCLGRGVLPYNYEGGICFLCNGSGTHGVREHKVYTPEYEAKLNARREEKVKQQEEEFNATAKDICASFGLTAEGHVFAVLDDTFSRKDGLKASGAKWNGVFWFFDNSVEGWNVAELDANSWIEKDFVRKNIKWSKNCEYEMKCKLQEAQAKFRTEQNKKSGTEFFGNVGDKVSGMLVEIEGVFSFDSFDYYGRPQSMYGYKMTDNAAHHFVWITGTPYFDLADQFKQEGEELDYKELASLLKGKKVLLKGTIKEHKEREGIKQTLMTRCKISKA